MYPGFTKEGGIDEGAYIVGSWSEIVAVVSVTPYKVGNCPDGVLEISREFYTHEDTSFPRKADMIIPIRAGMKFSGKLEEIHKDNVSLLLGQSLAPTLNYIYVGALTTSQFFTLRGRRMRNSDGVAIEFCIHKCMVSSLFSLGSGDDAQGSPLECTGLNDEDGDYGGSAQSPLGWIYVPNAGT